MLFLEKNRFVRHIVYNNYNTLKCHLKIFWLFYADLPCPSTFICLDIKKRCVLYWYYREVSISSFESLLSNSVLGPGFLWWMYSNLLSWILLSSSVRCLWASVTFWSSNNLNISPFLMPSFKKLYLGASSLYYTKFEEKREKEQRHDLSSFAKICLLTKTFSSFLEKVVRRTATGWTTLMIQLVTGCQETGNSFSTISFF